MVVLSIIITLFPLVPLWLILKDNNVELGTVPVVMIVAGAIFIGIVNYVRYKAIEDQKENSLRVALGFQKLYMELYEPIKKIEKLQEDVAKLINQQHGDK